MKKLLTCLLCATTLMGGLLPARADGPDYRIKEAPRVDDPKDVLGAILADYKGEVVLLDFWATWCAPCLRAMVQMEPHKAVRFKDVKFVYVTSKTSPRDKWEEMIPDLHGDHYYLSDTQLNAIYEEIGSNAFPTYVIVGRDGSRSRTFIGYAGESMLGQIDEALKKQ